jgi:glycosyltransferase involved in cell wall biosynthesis
MADRIVRLLTDDALRERMGRAGRAKVEGKYHAREYAKRIQAGYDEVLEG